MSTAREPSEFPEIRRATARDAPALAALTELSYEHYVPRIGLRPAPMDADHLAEVLDKVVWVAQEHEAVIGLVVLGIEPDHVLIENLAVAPTSQARGVGTLLLAAAERQARSAGVSEVRLYTHEAMTENIGYYTRRGYVETHRLRENGFSRVFFTKRLA
ncbi:MAG: hypothetical protein QOI06_2453 [Nocardioidaceae bacterium]|nr:hypothetical protein [Nocardioidaceae bacterium]